MLDYQRVTLKKRERGEQVQFITSWILLSYLFGICAKDMGVSENGASPASPQIAAHLCNLLIISIISALYGIKNQLDTENVQFSWKHWIFEGVSKWPSKRKATKFCGAWLGGLVLQWFEPYLASWKRSHHRIGFWEKLQESPIFDGNFTMVSG